MSGAGFTDAGLDDAVDDATLNRLEELVARLNEMFAVIKDMLAASNRFPPGVVAALDIPREVGKTFDYESRWGVSRWRVVMTPPDGSIRATKIGEAR